MTNLTRRNFILGSLGVASALGIAGCGSDSNNQGFDTQGATEELQEREEVTKYVVGDTVETDLVRLTLNDACFAIALGNSFPVGCDFMGNTAYGSGYSELEYFAPKEYSAEDDSDNPFVAPKGNILVYTEMTLECLDRDSLEVDDSLNDEFAVLNYEEEDYKVDIFETLATNKEYGIRADAEGNWENSGFQTFFLLRPQRIPTVPVTAIPLSPRI